MPAAGQEILELGKGAAAALLICPTADQSGSVITAGGLPGVDVAQCEQTIQLVLSEWIHRYIMQQI